MLMLKIVYNWLGTKPGEYLVMKRLVLTSGMSSPSTWAKKAYEEIFNSDPTHMQALRELLPPVGEVAVHKQRRRSATQA